MPVRLLLHTLSLDSCRHCWLPHLFRSARIAAVARGFSPDRDWRNSSMLRYNCSHYCTKLRGIAAVVVPDSLHDTQKPTSLPSSSYPNRSRHRDHGQEREQHHQNSGSGLYPCCNLMHEHGKPVTSARRLTTAPTRSFLQSKTCSYRLIATAQRSCLDIFGTAQKVDNGEWPSARLHCTCHSPTPFSFPSS